MPLPSSYSEGALIAFMETEVGPLLADLGLDTSDALLEAAYEIEGLLGHAIAAETDVVKLRALARWQAWVAALNAAMNQFDLGGSVPGLKRSQTFDHIEKRLAQAEASASRYDEAAAVLAGGYGTASVTTIGTSNDPYVYSPWPEF